MLKLVKIRFPVTPSQRTLGFNNTIRRFVTDNMSDIASNQRIDGPVITSVKKTIIDSLPGLFNLTIFNDSYKHAGHHGIGDSSNKTESHIRLEIISDDFKGLNLPSRHRMIYKLLDKDMKNFDIHAVQLSTKTIEESKRVKK